MVFKPIPFRTILRPGFVYVYYSEFKRVKRIEKVFEGLAYASVLIDTLVAVATLLFMHGIGGSVSASTFLVFSDYLVFFEVLLAGVIFGILMVMKHYQRVIDGMSELMFKTKYRKALVGQ
ncbi:MAG: hypothetical protein ACREBW_06325 [Candidatus Micrarchaeaceae archaeon]